MAALSICGYPKSQITYSLRLFRKSLAFTSWGGSAGVPWTRQPADDRACLYGSRYSRTRLLSWPSAVT